MPPMPENQTMFKKAFVETLRKRKLGGVIYEPNLCGASGHEGRLIVGLRGTTSKEHALLLRALRQLRAKHLGRKSGVIGIGDRVPSVFIHTEQIRKIGGRALTVTTKTPLYSRVIREIAEEIKKYAVG